MEREPVAQMDNGQPYVAPFLDSPSVNAMGGVISPIAAQVATIFTTITSVEVATIIYTSLLISTSVTIETSYINVAAPYQVPSISDIGLLPSLSSLSSASPADNKNMSTALTFPSLSESTSLPSSTSGSLPFTFPPINSTSTTNMPTSLPLSPTATAISRHESITKLMIGLVVGIFVAAGLLTSLLVYLRKKSNRVSEVEAANVQRQQQPLISEPVPYSSAYGSNGQK